MTTKEIGADVIKLPNKKATPPDGRLMLVPPSHDRCLHVHTSYEVCEDSGDCKCLKCGERVTAVFVLSQLMKSESRWMKTREAYQKEMNRLHERERTKCEHCGNITRISHR